MITRVFILIFLSCFNVVFGQQAPKTTQTGSIRVKVLASDNNDPIPFATVYLSQTTIGGTTGSDGNVEIKNVPFGTYELAVSEIRHKPYGSTIIIKSEERQDLTVKILPKTPKELTVETRRDDKWNRQYARFQKLFLGSDHLKDCKITNPWLLEFRIAQGYFIATASDPLKIENNYLGYDIEFLIKTCAFRPESFVIDGNVQYREKDGNDSLKAAWKQNRERVYRGSQQHFFRSLIDGTNVKEGFEVWSDISNTAGIVRYPGFNTNLGITLINISLSKGITSNNDGSYSIKTPPRLEIHYKGKPAKTTVYRRVNHPISWMDTKNDTLVVGNNGLVRNPKQVTVHGAMSDLRFSQWLPSNYQHTGVQETFEGIPADATTAMLEKPYIQTDRSYYYSGETMWLKGYMSYPMPMSRDTLSQSVYAELADANNNVVVTKRFAIEDGKFNGEIVLDQKLPAGLYQLRSYTAWMLNFDPELIFTKTIGVLGENQAVKVLPDYTPDHDTLPNISLKTNKTEYAAREKITLTVDVFDSLDFRTMSDLSIAVTDIDQAVPLKREKTILKNYSFDGSAYGNPKNVKYNVEYGIGFAGQFWAANKPVQAAITVFQDNSTENFAVMTDDSGQFYRSLTFNDTIKFYLKATSYNNKRGVVKMSENKMICPKLRFEPLMLDIYAAGSDHKPFKLDEVKVLDEVTVKATKIEKPRPGVLHGQSDYTITGDWLSEHHYNDIFLAISARVPGITYNNDRFNPRIHFAGAMNLKRLIFPLILVDNIVTDEASVSAIPVHALDRVEIIKSSGASIYGTRGFGGVIAIYTKRGMIEDLPKSFDKSEFQEVKLFGYSSTSTFKGPDYGNSEQDGRLDYRATIYWSPSVTTDGKTPAMVSFYAGDVVTKYRIVVEGITAAGLPVRAEKIIEVVKGR